MSKLTTIEGIGEVLAEKIKSTGVRSVESLLKKGASPQGRDNLSKESGLDKARVLKFVNHADLMRIKGVGGEYAELLEASGVDTVVELSRRNPDNLHVTMRDMNEQKKLVRQVPALAQVRDWVEQAKGLPRVISY